MCCNFGGGGWESEKTVKNATRPAIFKWRQTAPELILCAVRWYLRYSLSLRDVEELFAERGLEAAHTTIYSSAGPLVLPLSGHRFHRCHYRLPAVGAARCCGGQTPVPQGSQRFIAPPAPRHQYRSGSPLRLGDCSSERGRKPAPPLPTSTRPILEQNPG